MNNPSEAIMYSMPALDMYNKKLPSSELMEKSSVLVDIGIAYSSVGVDELAIKYYRRALVMKRKCLPQAHPDFSAIFNNLACSYSDLSKHLLALRYSLKSLRFRKRTETSNHPSIAESLKVMAHVYSNTGSLTRAMHYLIRARKILKKTLSDQHPDRIDIGNEIARLRNEINKAKRRMGQRMSWKRLL
jgi:tetratricopeptide (TPR) repeat protein